MADFDPSFVEQIFHVAQRKQVPNVHHHSKPNDLWAGFEVAKRGA